MNAVVTAEGRGRAATGVKIDGEWLVCETFVIVDIFPRPKVWKISSLSKMGAEKLVMRLDPADDADEDESGGVIFGGIGISMGLY